MSESREALAVFSFAFQDYAAWRKVWEEGAPIRARHGNIGAEAFQHPKDPNKVVVVDRYRDLGSLERFLADPHLKAAQERAGVTGAPTILIAVAG
jgi:quinol monooxygenase YgiN